MDDTIAAIATPVGEGGISIVRISGSLAITIADKIFHSKKGQASSFQSHTIHYGTIGINGDLLDHVMLTVMKSPHTYTTEDTVEINCHGGLLTAREVLTRCINNGARFAEPGEFTKRAFLNGRIDLTQAEGVTELISAKTERAHSAALRKIEGLLSAKVNSLRDLLVTVTAHVEAHIDFPEEDIEPDKSEELLAIIIEVSKKLERLSNTEREGKILREGIPIAIVGRPNVGKSSLMNVLLGQQRSIVTSIPGTTRDTIEELANIRGIPVRFSDTAGIRSARGSIERIGIERSHKAMNSSEITLIVFDRSRKLSFIDESILRDASNKKTIIVLNKNDLPKKLIYPTSFSNNVVLEISTLTEDGIDKLKDKILELATSKACGTGNMDVTINERHADAIRRALKSLSRAINEFKQGASLEILSQDLRTALDALGEIVGKTTDEDILDKIFSTFCIGK